MKLDQMGYRGVDDRMTALERAEAWLAIPENVARTYKLTIAAAAREARTNVGSMRRAADCLGGILVLFKGEKP